ncbi:MAG: 2-hydroxyacid dehydrogenase [Phycisphaeraceae bacterium]|nr:2-hydroxyacid dehydrogenase [Phycisphaeraceae bacterium]
MKVAVYSTRSYERPFFERANTDHKHSVTYLEPRLTTGSAVLANGYPAVSVFVDDDASAAVLRILHAGGTRLLALRSAGFNHVDVAEADRLGIKVLRVPAYSPYAVAEHAVGMMLTLNRKFHRAFNRVREQNFALDGLMGFDMHGKAVGVIGTGRIGEVVCRILTGFGCRVMAFDPSPSQACRSMGVEFVTKEDLYARSDIVTLHCPLTPQTRHMIDTTSLARMRPGVMLINTSRGAIIDSLALIESLKQGHVGSVGLDVYEEEGDLFFKDLSADVIKDDVFVRLMTFPNVLITAHQGFFTREACTAIAETTLGNLAGFESGSVNAENVVTPKMVV